MGWLVSGLVIAIGFLSGIGAYSLGGWYGFAGLMLVYVIILVDGRRGP